MNRLFIVFHLFLNAVELITNVCGQTYAVSTEKEGVRLEMWAESPKPDWNSLSISCAVTNLRAQPYFVEIDTAAGVPAVYFSMVDKAGAVVGASVSRTDRRFMQPGEAPFGSIGRRLLTGESMVVRVVPALDFGLPNPGGAQLKAIWNNGFSDRVAPSTLTLTLVLPEKPLVIKGSTTLRREFTPSELADRDDRANDGLTPLSIATLAAEKSAAESSVSGTIDSLAGSTSEPLGAGNGVKEPSQLVSTGSTTGEPEVIAESIMSTRWLVTGILILAALVTMWTVLKRRTT